jgi:hypothetical protein
MKIIARLTIEQKLQAIIIFIISAIALVNYLMF